MHPGQYTYQMALPKERKAVLVFSNDDTYSGEIAKIVTLGLMDSLLGLQVISGEWEKRVMDGWLVLPSSNQTILSKGLNLQEDSFTRQTMDCHERAAIVGKFTHSAYPPIEISQISTTHPLHPHLQAIQSRSLTAFGQQDIYVAHPKSVFVDTVLFIHHSGQIWNWVATATEQFKGEDKARVVVPFVDGEGQCRITRSGLGMVGDWWISGGRRRLDIQEDKQEVAEVWYNRTEGEEG